MLVNCRPSTGIAMCVFNGASYLKEQLDSITLQSELPDYMVIIDDGSVDGSWELLNIWAAAAPFPLELHRNSQTLGVIKNFERAIGLLRQEIIFLSDQDDIWNVNKISIFVDEFVADPTLCLAHSDAMLIDSEGQSLKWKLFDALLVTSKERTDVVEGNAYRVYTKRNLVTGASTAFRRSLIENALPFSSNWVHDEWLAFTAALSSKVVLINEVTMSYRLHDNNTVGLPIPGTIWKLKIILKALFEPSSLPQRIRAQRLREMQTQASRLGAPTAAQVYLASAVSHADFRGNLPRSYWQRLTRILEERKAGHYHAWSNGEISMLHDFLFGT